MVLERLNKLYFVACGVLQIHICLIIIKGEVWYQSYKVKNEF